MTIIVKEHEFHEELENALTTSSKAVYSARIEKESDETFDIRIWDERLEESCEDIEEGHFPSLSAAESRLDQIIEENSDVLFIKVETKTTA